MANSLNKAKYNKSKNPLNAFRSYNYLFTLAALKKNALIDPLSYRENEDYFVIARSSGKGTAGIQMPTSAATSTRTAEETATANNLIKDFNQKSPGRFDFYINNVNISTLMAGSNKTSMSLATQIDFEIFEPYSMSGFIEALQVSAVAAGYAQYSTAAYLLKMEFVGYSDNVDLPEPTTVDKSTRYFVFGFTGLEIDVTENGARYSCHAVPFNEKGFGNPSKLKESIALSGSTVGEILNSFQTNINKALESETAKLKGTMYSSLRDTYEIIFPEVDETGIVDKTENKNIKDATVVELLKDPAVYKFADPSEMSNTATNVASYSPTADKAMIFFAERANIQECISSILRDSQYTRLILDKFPDNVDSQGMVPYFMVHLEVTENGVYDEEANKPYYNYKYVIVPYKIHYTRIPVTKEKTVDTSTLISIINREYDYIYTGANVDIIKFKLNFNTLFFQAIPNALGSKKGQATAEGGVMPKEVVGVSLVSKSKEDTQNTRIGTPQILIGPNMGQINPEGVSNAGQPNKDPYATLAKSVHQAILDNVDQIQAEIEIIGDPYYLVTGSMGNYRPKINAEDGTAGDGEAPYTTSDVMVALTFRNPSDIDPVTGQLMFDQVTAPYSGVFRVLEVKSVFRDGNFTQTLSLVRIPAQLIDTNKPVEALAAAVKTQPDPANIATPEKPPVVSTVRASPDSLMASITAGLPVAGLPGQFSQLVSNITGGLSGNISSAAAGLVQWGQTAASAGIAGAADLANTTLASGLGSVETIGSNAIAAATSLGSSAAGVISGVAAKVSALSGGSVQGLLKEATSGINPSTLGIDTSKLSGLSANLQSKVSKQLTDAIKTIPENVDINVAAARGLILNNIPKTGLANIPATQPFSIAPPAIPNITDLAAIINRGGSLANIPGASSIPGIDKILAATNIKLPSANILDASAIAGKLATVQGAVNNITGQLSSVEASLGKISAAIPSGLPNVSDISSSVVSKFGSVSASVASPLSTLLKSKS